jgi:putative oxygen-independent coproporphyrinogen III oxidase
LTRIGIYVHWPFCQSKCPYCDFNSHVADRIDHADWRHAYVAELERYAAILPDATVGSIFFGGGTPSLMEPETVSAIIDGIRSRWRTTNYVEVTLEANPSSVEAERFRSYLAAGVNRVSLGIQALSDDDLRRLGRLHSVAEARTAFDVARSTFDRVNVDLIYGRQDQTLADWRTELATALSLGADHMSLYQLTIEPGTAFGRRAEKGGLPGLPDEDLAADLYEMTQEMTAAAGLPAYEISNHAKPGAESRHNLLYWTGGDYVGLGPGAHGRVTFAGRRIATEAVSAPVDWLKRVDDGSEPDRWIPLSDQDILEERILMGLRIEHGVDLDILGRVPDAVSQFQNMGLIQVEDGAMSLTRRGRPLLDAIVRELLI